MITLLASRNDGVPPFFVFMGFAIAIFILLRNERDRRTALRSRVARLNERLRGTYTPGGIFNHHAIRFTILDQPGTLEFGEGKSPFTQLRVALPWVVQGSVYVTRNNPADFLLRPFNGPRVLSGDRRFDGEYSVRSRPESLGQKLFRPDRRPTAMMAVRRLNHCAGFSVQFGGDELLVRIQEMWESADIAQALVRTAEDLLRFLLDLDVERGIQAGSLVETGRGRCPICTTALSEPLVRCDRCRAPHHQECWDYAGRCAVYGCEPNDGQRAA